MAVQYPPQNASLAKYLHLPIIFCFNIILSCRVGNRGRFSSRPHPQLVHSPAFRTYRQFPEGEAINFMLRDWVIRFFTPSPSGFGPNQNPSLLEVSCQRQFLLTFRSFFIFASCFFFPPGNCNMAGQLWAAHFYFSPPNWPLFCDGSRARL